MNLKEVGMVEPMTLQHSVNQLFNEQLDKLIFFSLFKISLKKERQKPCYENGFGKLLCTKNRWEELQNHHERYLVLSSKHSSSYLPTMKNLTAFFLYSNQ